MNKLTTVVLFLAACGTSSPDDPILDSLRNEEPAIDRLVFDTSSTIAQNQPPDVTVTVTGDAARAVYAATLALPGFGSQIYACPANGGITYTLAFYSGDAEVVTGTLEPAGCENATLMGSVGSVSLSVNDDYWATLATDLGIAESEIYPYVVH